MGCDQQSSKIAEEHSDRDGDQEPKARQAQHSEKQSASVGDGDKLTEKE
jgi:hypothetical protein